MDENLSRGYIRLGKLRTPQDFRFRNGFSRHLSPPVDSMNAIYFAFVLSGVGFLLPYNSFTIAVDYYNNYYPKTTIVFDMSLVYIIMAFFAVLANNFLVETLPLNTRIAFGYIVSCTTLFTVVIGEFWLGLTGTNVGYIMHLVAVAVVALGCTVQQSSFYGYTSMLPSRYTQAVMAGESAAGFLISINRILTKSMMANDKYNTCVFFATSIIISGMCFFFHNVVYKSEFVQFYITLCQESKKITLEPSEDLGLMDPSEPQYGVLKLQSPENGAEYSKGQFSTLSFANPAYEPQASGPTYKVEDVMGTEVPRPGKWRGLQRGIRARWDVSKSIWPFMLTIGLAYFVTLSLYPGIESQIRSCHFRTWMPVVIMAIFNASDLIGKMLAAISNDWSRSSMLIVAGCRLLLVPLVVLCAYPREAPFISGEGYPMFFSMLLGLTNGLVGSIPMIQAPCKVSEEHRELAGNIMTLSYNLGLTGGSIAAYVLNSYIETQNTTLVEYCNKMMTWTRSLTRIVKTTTTPVTTITVPLTTAIATLLPISNVTIDAFNSTLAAVNVTTMATPLTVTHFFNLTTTSGLN